MRPGVDLGLLVAAAWLHDIGYASPLVDTGFHPIDGARHLRGLAVDERVVNLVAHHSCARIEAGLRGLEELLQREFPRDPSLPHDELCFCDQTTGPDGDVVDLAERLAEIRGRYEDGDVVRRFVDLAEPELVADCPAGRGGVRASAEVGLGAVLAEVVDALAHARVHLHSGHVAGVGPDHLRRLVAGCELAAGRSGGEDD